MKRIGVLAVQGAFAEHIAILRGLGRQPIPVRLPSEFKNLDGLIIPGGESTTITKLIEEYHLDQEIVRLIEKGCPIFGTCAGMILLARKVDGQDGGPLGIMDIEVKRNAFGRQVDSFEADLDIPSLGSPSFHAVFIRAPRIENVGARVEEIAKLSNGTVVAAREKNILCTAFHPELTSDIRFHKYFLNLVQGGLKADTVEVR